MPSQFIDVSTGSMNIFDPISNITTYIKVAKNSNPTDVTVKLKPTTTFYLSSSRLENYKRSIEKFLVNPTFNNSINKPTIQYHENDSNIITVTMSEYESYVMLPYSSTMVQVSSDSGFNTIVHEKLVNNVLEPNVIKFNANSLTHNTRYYLRVRYGGGGYYSEWSDYLEFLIDKPTINKPSITPITSQDLSYKLTPPYSVTIRVRSSAIQNGTYHSSTTWTVYGEGDNGNIVPVWSKVKDGSNLTSITLSNLYPDTLKYGKEYWITCKYYSNDKYSEESEPVSFCADGLSTESPDDITIFPRLVNTPTPLININKDIKLSVNGKEVFANEGDITSVYWTIYEEDTGVQVNRSNTRSFDFKVPSGTLKPNTKYRVDVFYIHNSIGISPTSSRYFNTIDFNTNKDKLETPFKVFNKMAYYGEINDTSLATDKLIYKGEYVEGSMYNYGEEVKKDGKLYVCTSTTPNSYEFDKYFKEPGEVETEEIYRSYLPTPKWLIKMSGLYPKLSIQDGSTGDTNLINSNSGWIKCQNEREQTIYISKLPIMRNVSINDLIRCDLYHPRRKTVRLGNKLYYVRILVNKLLVGNDGLSPNYINKNLYKDQRLHEEVIYNENILLEYLMSGVLANFSNINLDIDDITAKELIYHHDEMVLYRADNNSSTIRLIPGEIDSGDIANIALRLVLEEIDPSSHPLLSLEKTLPGNNDISNYDPILDYCYMGFVNIDEFVNSEYIDIKSDLISNLDSPNKGWFKFYYRGLIYYFSYGSNLRNISPRKLLEHGLLTPTPLYPSDSRTPDKYNGKILFNNLFFNVSCPSVLTYNPQHKVTMTEAGSVVDIFQNKNINLDIKMAYESFLSDTIYPLLKNKNPIRDKAGYKGSFKNLHVDNALEKVGSSSLPEDTFITSNFLKNGNIVLNYQLDPYSMKEGTLDQLSDAVFVLTIHPNYRNKNKW